MTNQASVAATTRINVLAVVGSSLLFAGLYSAFSIWYSMLGRYMYVEDLGLGMSEESVFAVTRVTPTDKGLLIVAAVLAVLGLIAIVSAAVRSIALRRRSGTD